MKKALVIGGGFAGCAMSHQLELIGGWDTTLIEKAPFLGAGVRTNFYGGHPYTFGPRHFLTPYTEVYEYLNSIIPLRNCSEHEFITYVEKDNDFYSYPINMQDVKRMPDSNQVLDEIEIASKKQENIKAASNLEDYWISSVGKTLFDKFIKNYNKKMWQVDDCKKIDTFSWSPKGIALKDGPKAAWSEIITAYPIDINGYNNYFSFSTKTARVILNAVIQKIDIEKKELTINNNKSQFDVIINTVSPDEIMNFMFGKLNYLGREFHKIVFPTENVFPDNVYFLYYANEERFTRLVEYKKFTKHKSRTTLIGMEIPTLGNGKYYPLPFKKDLLHAKKYFDQMSNYKNVFSIGRNGTYKYGVDIDDCIRQAMQVADHLKSGSYSYCIPNKDYIFDDKN
jgi:UDP-galactopyranose mutase